MKVFVCSKRLKKNPKTTNYNLFLQMDSLFCFYGAQELEPSSESDSFRRLLLKMHSDADSKTSVSSIGGLKRPRLRSARQCFNRWLVEKDSGAGTRRANRPVIFVRDIKSELYSR